MTRSKTTSATGSLLQVANEQAAMIDDLRAKNAELKAEVERWKVAREFISHGLRNAENEVSRLRARAKRLWEAMVEAKASLARGHYRVAQEQLAAALNPKKEDSPPTDSDLHADGLA